MQSSQISPNKKPAKPEFPTKFLIVVVAILLLGVFAVWKKRVFSVKTHAVVVSVAPAEQPSPKIETSGDGSPIVTGVGASTTVTVNKGGK